MSDSTKQILDLIEKRERILFIEASSSAKEEDGVVANKEKYPGDPFSKGTYIAGDLWSKGIDYIFNASIGRILFLWVIIVLGFLIYNKASDGPDWPWNYFGQWVGVSLRDTSDDSICL